MMVMRFQRKWEAAHRLIEGLNANTKCSQPHGHTWNVTVTLALRDPKILNGSDNLMVPFEKAKTQWHNWIDNSVDHSCFFNHRDPMFEFTKHINPGGRNVVTPGDPTTEMIAVTFKAKLHSFLKASGDELICTSVLIQETQTNAIEFTGDPYEHLSRAAEPGAANALAGPGAPKPEARPLSHNETPSKYWWGRADHTTSDES